MSQETIEYLNSGNNIKLGFTAQRGELYAWHYDAELAAQNLDDGHAQQYYTGAVPVSDVLADILNWQALTAPVSYTDQNGVLRETTDQVIYRSDTGEALKTGFKDGYQIHQFSEFMMEKTSLVTGLSVADIANINNGTAADMLQIASVGVLKSGSQFWTQFELPETVKTVKHNVEFRPSLMFGTSHDGTIASQWGLVHTMIVCDNTFAAARGEASKSAVKVKHTKYSHNSIASAGDALGLVREAGNDFAVEIDNLIETKVTGAQFIKFLDVFNTIPDADGRGKTMAEAKREQLLTLWMNDERVAPFVGTAFGVLQLTNTYNQHIASVHAGTDRTEKRYSDLLTGKLAKRDSETMDVLSKILQNA